VPVCHTTTSFAVPPEELPGGQYTLHQLRHSGLAHAAKDGASTPMLMALSGHTSVR
jgi:integrase/recombinase XerC/integrase/recombinase XerD